MTTSGTTPLGKAFATIYARRDGACTVVMGGAITTDALAGTGRWTSTRLDSEAAARRWIGLGVKRYGIPNMPEPKVVRR